MRRTTNKITKTNIMRRITIEKNLSIVVAVDIENNDKLAKTKNNYQGTKSVEERNGTAE